MKPLLPLPKPKPKAERPGKDDLKILNGIISIVLAVNGKQCQDFIELQAPYMMDFRNSADQDYLRKCRKLV
jgi:hypothetical protein